MSAADIVILVIIAGFALAGFRFGVIHTFGSLLGTVLGIYLASRYYENLANWLVGLTGWSGNGPKILMFILSFIIINRLVGFVFWIIDHTVGLIARLPFLNSINHLAGLVLGFAEGVITISVVIYFIERIPFSSYIMQYLANSAIAPKITQFTSFLWPLLPQALRVLKSTVDYVENIIVKK